jgi:hypothetical protein
LKSKTLPLINTDDTDLKEEQKTLPRINADERGSGNCQECQNCQRSPKLKNQEPLKHRGTEEAEEYLSEGISRSQQHFPNQ